MVSNHFRDSKIRAEAEHFTWKPTTCKLSYTKILNIQMKILGLEAISRPKKSASRTFFISINTYYLVAPSLPRPWKVNVRFELIWCKLSSYFAKQRKDMQNYTTATGGKKVYISCNQNKLYHSKDKLSRTLLCSWVYI